MNQPNTSITSQSEKFDIPQGLLQKLSALTKREDIILRFVDYDGTLMDDEVRFLIDAELRNHRKNAAILYINQNFSDENDPTGIRNFVALLNPKNHIFANTHEIFDPENPHDFILSAGNITYQKEKIDQSGFPSSKQVLIVLEAQRKPLVMLLTCLKLGYIPGKIEFYDNNIDDFGSVDITLSETLGIPVNFFRVTALSKRKKLAVSSKTKSRIQIQRTTQGKINDTLRGGS